MANERTSDEAVRNKTGKTWLEWYEILDKAGARELRAMPPSIFSIWTAAT
jgi:hypothetical protein